MAALPTRSDINVETLSLLACELSTREIGIGWLALMRGQDSVFTPAVARSYTYAAKRLAAPNWQSTRLRVFERDGYKCTYCGSPDRLECDHVIPVSKDGGHEDDNLTTACRSCNRRKRNLLPEEWAV